MLDALLPEERSQLLQSIGTHKSTRVLDPIRVAALIQKASQKQTLGQIATDLELRGTTMLTRFLSLLALPIEVQNLVSWRNQKGFIAFSTANEISRRTDSQERMALAKATLEHSLSKTEVQAIVQRSLRGNLGVDTAIKEILRLRPVVERQYMFMGTVRAGMHHDDEVAEKKLRAALSRLFGDQHVLSVSIKGGRFTFLLSQAAVSGSKFAGQLSADRIENFVAGLLS